MITRSPVESDWVIQEPKEEVRTERMSKDAFGSLYAFERGKSMRADWKASDMIKCNGLSCHEAQRNNGWPRRGSHGTWVLVSVLTASTALS